MTHEMVVKATSSLLSLRFSSTLGFWTEVDPVTLLNSSLDSRNTSNLVHAFFTRRYLGKILNKIALSLLIFPLLYVNLKQLATLDSEVSFYMLAFFPSVVVIKSSFYFEYLRWNTKMLSDVRFLVDNWWTFGWFNDSDEFQEDNSLDVNFEEDEVLVNHLHVIDDTVDDP